MMNDLRPDVREGKVAVPGGEVWYRRMGSGGVPLVIVHGGPGYPCDMFFDAFEPVADEREVVFYDQLGVGRSDSIDDPSLLVVDRYLDELGAVIAGLGLQRPHVFGHSWGAMIGLNYAAERAPEWTSFVCDSGLASVPQFSREVRELMATMPGNVLERIYGRELIGNTDHPDYVVARGEFRSRYILRNPNPDATLTMDRDGPGSPGVSRVTLETMWGPGDHHVTGTLKDWDVWDKLGDIAVPTLVLGSEFDVCLPSHLEEIARRIPDSEYVNQPGATHVWCLEEEPPVSERVAVIRDFLARVEARSGDGHE